MMQALLVVTAAVLLMFAGYTWGRAAGIDEAQRSDDLGGTRAPSPAQVIVPALLGLGSLTAAFLLQAGAGVRLLTPARLEQMQTGAGDAAEDPGAASEARGPREERPSA